MGFKFRLRTYLEESNLLAQVWASRSCCSDYCLTQFKNQDYKPIKGCFTTTIWKKDPGPGDSRATPQRRSNANARSRKEVYKLEIHKNDFQIYVWANLAKTSLKILGKRNPALFYQAHWIQLKSPKDPRSSEFLNSQKIGSKIIKDNWPLGCYRDQKRFQSQIYCFKSKKYRPIFCNFLKD